ncbi:MAG: hypothetical protein R2690_14985 [Acidimicrobiales bacterium]
MRPVVDHRRPSSGRPSYWAVALISVLHQLEQRHLGRRTVAGVGGDDRHVAGDRQRLSHVIGRVVLLAVEQVDRHDERHTCVSM